MQRLFHPECGSVRNARAVSGELFSVTKRQGMGRTCALDVVVVLRGVHQSSAYSTLKRPFSLLISMGRGIWSLYNEIKPDIIGKGEFGDQES